MTMGADREPEDLACLSCNAGSLRTLLWHYNEFTLHQLEQVLRRIEVATIVVIKNRLDLPMVQNQLKHIELFGAQVAQFASHRGRHRQGRIGGGQLRT